MIKAVNKALDEHFAKFEVMSITSTEDQQKLLALYSLITLIGNKRELSMKLGIPSIVFMNSVRITAERRLNSCRENSKMKINGYLEEMEILLKAMGENWEDFLEDNE